MLLGVRADKSALLRICDRPGKHVRRSDLTSGNALGLSVVQGPEDVVQVKAAFERPRITRHIVLIDHHIFVHGAVRYLRAFVWDHQLCKAAHPC
jgi:hypothetical protein